MMTALPTNTLLTNYRKAVSQYRQALKTGDTGQVKHALTTTQRSLQAVVDDVRNHMMVLPKLEVSTESLMRMTPEGQLRFDPSHRYGGLIRALHADQTLERRVALTQSTGKKAAVDNLKAQSVKAADNFNALPMEVQMAYHRQGQGYQKLRQDISEERADLAQIRKDLEKPTLMQDSLQKEIPRIEARLNKLSAKEQALLTQYPQLPQAVHYANESSATTYQQRTRRLADALGKEVPFKEGTVLAQEPTLKVKKLPNKQLQAKVRTLQGKQHPGHHLTQAQLEAKSSALYDRFILAYTGLKQS
jgi:hypothetical protein